MLGPARDLFQTRQFGGGLTAGLIVALVTLAVIGVRILLRRDRAATVPRWMPGGVGVAFVIATAATIGGFGPLRTEIEVPAGVLAGLAALWCAGAVSTRFPNPPLAGALLALPGGMLLVTGAEGFPAWTVALLTFGPALAGTAAADLDDRVSESGAVPVLFAIALAGMYITVPDTELARIALGAAVPVTLLAWPITMAKLGRGGSYAAVGMFLWIAVLEGVGRSGSTVGAAACLGVLVAEPIGRLVGSHQPADRSRRYPPAATYPGLLVAAQLVLVIYFARVAGFQPLAVGAAALAIPGFVVAVVIAARSSPSEARTADG
jgi:hypothetical protein